jgi:hypothetical protein
VADGRTTFSIITCQPKRSESHGLERSGKHRCGDEEKSTLRHFNLDARGARDTRYHPSSLTNQSIASSRVLNLRNSRWEKVFSAS